MKKEKKLLKNPFAICETIASFANAFNANKDSNSMNFLINGVIKILLKTINDFLELQSFLIRFLLQQCLRLHRFESL